MALSIAKRVLFIVVVVSIVAMLIMIADYYRTGAAVASQATTGQQITNTIGIMLYIGQTIGQQIQALTEYHLLCLGTYQVQTNAGRTSARQYLRFTNGFPGGSIVFKQAEVGRATSDYLTFAGNQPLFEFEAIFDSGLASEIVDGDDLEDLDGEMIYLMGAAYTVLEAKVDTSSKTVKLKLIGSGGLVVLKDQYDDTLFTQGVEINGKSVYAEVMIIGAREGTNEFGIYSIRYRPLAYNTLDVASRYGIRASMREPEKLLNPDFNMFYLGVRSGDEDRIIKTTQTQARPSAIGPGVIDIKAVGDDQYKITFTTREATYSIPLVTIRGGSLVLGDDKENLIVKESNQIFENDYFMVSSGTNINDRTNILVYDRMDFKNNIVYIKDYKGGQKSVKFDSSGKGYVIAGGQTYEVQVDMANPNHPIKVDLDGSGSIGANTVEAVLIDGTRLQLGFTTKYSVPRKLLDEATGDEISNIILSKSGNEVRLQVSYPNMISSGKGTREGMMKYGSRFYLDETGDNPQELKIAMPGGVSGGIGGGFGFNVGVGQAQAGLLVTCEEGTLRARQMEKQTGII